MKPFWSLHCKVLGDSLGQDDGGPPSEMEEVGGGGVRNEQVGLEEWSKTEYCPPGI